MHPSQTTGTDLQSFIATNLSNNPRRISAYKQARASSPNSSTTTDCGRGNSVERIMGAANKQKNHKGAEFF